MCSIALKHIVSHLVKLETLECAWLMPSVPSCCRNNIVAHLTRILIYSRAASVRRTFAETMLIQLPDGGVCIIIDIHVVCDYGAFNYSIHISTSYDHHWIMR